MSKVIEACQSWVERVVVAHQFCPFAKKEVEDKKVRYCLFDGTDDEVLLHLLIDECRLLDENRDIETTLIVIETAYQRFGDFLDVIDLSETLIQKMDYEGVYQVASFHPDYCFEGDEENDASNYTNRSPYPMLHLLREESLERAVDSYPDPESIPENNIQLAREKGSDYFKQILNEIKKGKES